MKDYESVMLVMLVLGILDHLPHHLYAQLNVEQLALELFYNCKTQTLLKMMGQNYYLLLGNHRMVQE